jgi:hypothetical protein
MLFVAFEVGEFHRDSDHVMLTELARELIPEVFLAQLAG